MSDLRSALTLSDGGGSYSRGNGRDRTRGRDGGVSDGGEGFVRAPVVGVSGADAAESGSSHGLSSRDKMELLMLENEELQVPHLLQRT